MNDQKNERMQLNQDDESEHDLNEQDVKKS